MKDSRLMKILQLGGETFSGLCGGYAMWNFYKFVNIPQTSYWFMLLTAWFSYLSYSMWKTSQEYKDLSLQWEIIEFVKEKIERKEKENGKSNVQK